MGLVLLLWPALVGADSWQRDVIGGQVGVDALRVEVICNGNMGVFCWQESEPGSGNETYVNRYYEDVAWSSILFFTGSSGDGICAGDYFQDLIFGQPGSSVFGWGEQSVLPGGASIQTCWTWPDGLKLVQELDCPPGSDIVCKRFAWTNTGTTLLLDLCFIHGGDVFFGDEAHLQGTEEPLILTVANRDETVGGRIDFWPDVTTPWNGWFIGELADGLEQLENGGLGRHVAVSCRDAACLVQWTRPVLEPGETWLMITYERHGVDLAGETGETGPVASSSTDETTQVSQDETTASVSGISEHEAEQSEPVEAVSAPVATGEGCLSACLAACCLLLSAGLLAWRCSCRRERRSDKPPEI
jgi:hypothetical protein